MTTILVLSMTTTTTTTVTALMPPHPDMPPDEQRQLQARHENATATASSSYHYEPSLLHPAMCQHISSKDCELSDKRARYHADRSLQLMESTGQINVLVLLIRFQDHEDRDLPTKAEIDTLLNGDDIDIDLTPTGSVKEWLRVNSYNQLDIRMNVMDWTTTDNTEAHYSFGVEGMHPDYTGAFEYVLQQMDDEGMDWSRYDVDNDGYIDSLLILHSGYAAEMGGRDCYTQATKSNRIWSHAIPWHQAYPWTSQSGIKVGAYVTSSALRGRCGSLIARIGVIAHELIHTWGVPDLYDSSWLGKGTGVFDCMSNPYGRAGDSLNPTFLSPWSRMELGWLDPVLLEQDGEYIIGPSEEFPQVYKVEKGFAYNEYLLIENRQPLEWDRDLWQGGVLIWHIDNAVFSQRYRGHPKMQGWPGNNQHYKVALLQADGEYHLETNQNIGDSQDFFTAGNTLEPGPGTPTVDLKDPTQFYPNTDSYQYGNIQSTGIRFSEFSESQQFMSFKVTGLSAAAATEAPTTTPETPNPTTANPTKSPTPSPTKNPTTSPTKNPTAPPTKKPTASPTKTPTTSAPVTVPTTPSPTRSPTVSPTLSPTVTPPTLTVDMPKPSITQIVFPTNDEDESLTDTNIAEPANPSMGATASSAFLRISRWRRSLLTILATTSGIGFLVENIL